MTYSGESPTDQLTRVQAMIAKIEGGLQSYSIKDRRAARADLQTLYGREKELLNRVQREASGGIRVRGVTPA